MASHTLCGLTLDSALPFPELVVQKNVEIDVHLELQTGSPPLPETEYKHSRSLPNGAPWLQVARSGDEFRLLFPGLAEFLLSGDGTRVRCSRLQETPDGTLRHLFLDQVIPLLLNLRGKLAIHASAVAVPGGTIAVLGDAGVGKSTLIGALARGGHALLADDCLVLEEENGEFSCLPAYPGLRLWEDSASLLFGANATFEPVAHYSSKLRLPAIGSTLQFCTSSSPIDRLYVLAAPDDIQEDSHAKIAQLAPQEGLFELIKQVQILDPQDKELLRKSFDRCTRLALALPLFRLRYRRNMQTLNEVCQTLLSHAAVSAPGKRGITA
jgi:hypothetical protein